MLKQYNPIEINQCNISVYICGFRAPAKVYVGLMLCGFRAPV
jgi:hypothetical protein